MPKFKVEGYDRVYYDAKDIDAQDALEAQEKYLDMLCEGKVEQVTGTGEYLEFNTSEYQYKCHRCGTELTEDEFYRKAAGDESFEYCDPCYGDMFRR